MRSWLAIGMLSAMSGCFYFDSINQRPGAQIQIVPIDGKTDAHRGAPYKVQANTDDPDGDIVSYKWRAYACVEPATDATCDHEPFLTSVSREFEFVVAKLREDRTAPTQLRVKLEATDELGAIAKPQAELVVPILAAPPTVELQAFSRYHAVGNESVYVVGTPIDLFVRVGDTDDGPGKVMLAWTVFNPQGGADTLVDHDPAQLEDPDPNYLQWGKVLTPNQPGTWEVEVVGTDPAPTSLTATEMVSLVVAADGEPCLGALQPLVPPMGSALPMSAPTLFRVPAVSDDLDRYPLVANDALFRAPKFQWSIQSPGGSTHVVVPAATSNSLAIDPANYRVGDVLEVRVQIYDRKNTVIPCADGEATCSTISQPTCLQRQTWRVEVR